MKILLKKFFLDHVESKKKDENQHDPTKHDELKS